MSEPGKQQIGDGRDNYGQAARETSKAAKNIAKGMKDASKEVSKNLAGQAVFQGTDAAVKTTSVMSKAGVEAGKVVSKVAAGTATGGPWGAAIMAALSIAWSMRHTLFKILICICLVIVIFIACIVSLPNIIFQNITDMFGIGQEETIDINTFDEAYKDLARATELSVQSSYAMAVKQAREIISSDKYDQKLSRCDFNSSLDSSFDYDVAHFLAAYSVSMGQTGTNKTDFLSKLDGAADKLFTVVATEKTAEVTRKVEGGEKIFTVTYVVCTIEFYNRATILDIFSVEKDTEYKNYGITKGEYVDFLAASLEKTLAGVPEH